MNTYKDFLLISEFVEQFYHTNLPTEIAYKALRDSLSQGQIRSKLQILDICKNLNIKSDNSVFIGHWHGILPFLMNKQEIIKSAIGYELSAEWSDFSNQLNKDWQWVSHCQNILNVTYEKKCDLIVNTSCEHMTDEWIYNVPAGVQLILQSTNFEHSDHVNHVSSLAVFEKNLSFLKIEYANEIECPAYKRFTVMARR